MIANAAVSEFLADLEGLGAEYAREAERHAGDLQAVKDECARRVQEAERAYWQAARESNAAYALRVREAARRRAEAPEADADTVRGAASAVLATLGGPLHDLFEFSGGAARAYIEQEREEGEGMRWGQRESSSCA